MAEITLFGTSGVFPEQNEATGIGTVLTATTSTVQGDIDNNDGSEVIFNLLEQMSSVVSASDATKVRVVTNQNLNGSTLTKNYTFSVDLNLTDIGDLDVQDEPA